MFQIRLAPTPGWICRLLALICVSVSCDTQGASLPRWIESCLARPLEARPSGSLKNRQTLISFTRLHSEFTGVRAELQAFNTGAEVPEWRPVDLNAWPQSVVRLNSDLEEVAVQVPKTPPWTETAHWFRVAYIPTAPAILGPQETYPNPGMPTNHWAFFPDSKLTIVPDGEDQVQIYWGSYYRSVGPTWREAGVPNGVLENGGPNDFDSGSVVMAVFRKSEQELFGFYHAEDYTFGPERSTWISWKSIASCYSTNNGASWIKRGRILATAEPKPETPTWGGHGDFCVVRDAPNSRWICLFTGITNIIDAAGMTNQWIWMSAAASTDPEGLPGTWKKLYEGRFDQPGLGGLYDRLPGFASFQGALQNPAVHWNRHLGKYVMLTHVNGQIPPGSEVVDGSIYFSTSDDLIHWAKPVLLVEALPNERVWYPTVIGTTDAEAGQEAELVYSYQFPWWSTLGVKKFIHRPMQFW